MKTLLLSHLLVTVCAFLFAASDVHAFYMAEAGRWINRDPIREQGGINLYGFVGNMPIRNADFFGLTGGVPGGTTGLPDESNCLGYAMTGDPSVFAQPALGQSMQNFLKNNGWSCGAVSDPAQCNCKCGQVTLLLYLQVAINKKSPNWDKEKNCPKDPYREPMVYGGQDDYHAMRNSCGCMDDFEEIGGRGPNTRKPRPANPTPPMHGPLYCCCKDKE